jgi:hypothetical protein
MWRRNISGTQEGGHSPLELGTRGLVKGQHTKRTQCVYSELQTDCMKYR